MAAQLGSFYDRNPPGVLLIPADWLPYYHKLSTPHAGFYQELLPDFQNQYSVNYLGRWLSNTVYWPWFRFLNFYLYTSWMALRTAQNNLLVYLS